MDHNFTEKLGAWLHAAPDSRDYAAGCLMFLQLTNRTTMYKNLLAVPDMARLEAELQKHYNFRVADLTKEQGAQMSEQVETIAADKNLEGSEDDRPAPRGKSCASREQSGACSDSAERSQDSPKGKRPDHDSLPPEIQALYVENLSVLRRMREVHLRLRTLSLDDHPCPDSERYPFLKELIDLDKKYRGNWKAYDEFTA